MLLTSTLKQSLFDAGVECHLPENHSHITDGLCFEPPCGIKSMDMHHSCSIGSFSYGVSGFYSYTDIGRYCSMGESVQCGRGAHPSSWMSTSPFFYCGTDRMFHVGGGFPGASEFATYQSSHPEHPAERNGRTIPNFLKKTVIGNDVWIGHGAFIAQGVIIGDGAVVAGHSVVTKNVPPYAIVGGNPAQILSFRFTAQQIGRLLDLQWWRFAAWDLKDLDYPYIDKVIEQLTDITREKEPYNPGYRCVRDLPA
ncbi:CatB-related O-acetyltransferase [Methylobacterium sp. WL69]|jgi:acetyltransferase-like isoleucine patch superfamily enzyme|uniref:CatB-related O-acetyltransferase n=1 Tax=Methylobacterium sp. WL69 TaxID=2603893 RepID=UPI002484D500|nr:CatB-related O-acetyltransferase [Methylobacterium sp. WL69]